MVAHQAPTPADRNECQQKGAKAQALKQKVRCIGTRPTERVGHTAPGRIVQGRILRIEEQGSDNQPQPEKKQKETQELDQALAEKVTGSRREKPQTTAVPRAENRSGAAPATTTCFSRRAHSAPLLNHLEQAVQDRFGNLGSMDHDNPEKRIARVATFQWQGTHVATGQGSDTGLLPQPPCGLLTITNFQPQKETAPRLAPAKAIADLPRRHVKEIPVEAARLGNMHLVLPEDRPGLQDRHRNSGATIAEVGIDRVHHTLLSRDETTAQARRIGALGQGVKGEHAIERATFSGHFQHAAWW